VQRLFEKIAAIKLEVGQSFFSQTYFREN